MKVIKKGLLIIFLIALCVSLCACSAQKSKIKTLTKDFENACNKLDFNSMLDCIEPEISKSVKTVTGIIGMFSDDDTDELLDKLGKVLFRELPGNTKDFFSSIKISLDNIEEEEDKATATAEISYDISGEDRKVSAIFEYICIDGKWYISNIDMN